MNVEILYFAGAREITGRARETLDLPVTVTNIAALLAWLSVRYPELAPHIPSLRIARNETFASNDELLAPNDVLAVIPPVAGG